MSPALNGSSAIWHFKHSDAIKIRDGIIFDSYTGLAHMYTCVYPSLTKECTWVEHLTSLPKMGVGALSSVSAFNHERVPMSCLQRLNVFNYTTITYNEITSGFEVES